MASASDKESKAEDAGEADEYELPDHGARLARYTEHEEQQEANMAEALLDRDYIDGYQLSEKKLKALKRRGQAPVVNNVIAKKFYTLIGEQIEKRFDPVGKPRTPAHEDDARAMTDGLRAAADEQNTQQVATLVAASMLGQGIGAAIKHVDENGKLQFLHVPYDRFGYDIHSRDPWFRDAGCLWHGKWLDRDVAEKLFPDADGLLDDAFSGNEATDDAPRDWIDRSRGRARVLVIEYYFECEGDWYVSYFTKKGDLRPPEKTWLVNEHGKHVCPLIAVSAYVDKDGNRYGAVRNLRSLQDAINDRESKALHLLNTVSVIAEKGIIDQPDTFLERLGSPDKVAEVVEGGLADPASGGRPRILVERHLDLAQGHVMLLQDAKASINSNGPSASNLPELPADASGRAQIMRRKAAALDYAILFDQLSFWLKMSTELDWYAIRTTWTEEKWIRVTDDQERTGFRWVGLNRKMTRAERFMELVQAKPPVPPQKALSSVVQPMMASEIMFDVQQMAQQSGQPPAPDALVQLVASHPLMREQMTANDVSQIMIDVVLDEAPDTAIIAEEQFQTLSEMAGLIMQARPDMAPKMARMMIKASSLPDKRALVEEFDKAPDPQQQQLQQQNQQLTQRNAILELELKQAQIQKTTADATLSDARAKTELQQLALPMPGAQPEPPDPLKHAKAQRELANIPLDAAKAHAQVVKDHSAAAKNAAGAAQAARAATEPVAEVMQ
jgi:hypothetical protein